jgi:coproporphyrinogen III oxidase
LLWAYQLAFHPRNWHVPTVHMNVRSRQRPSVAAGARCWFGGGTDLTPYYAYEEDALHHQTRDALATVWRRQIPRFKQWCDEYFLNRK